MSNFINPSDFEEVEDMQQEVADVLAVCTELHEDIIEAYAEYVIDN